MAKRRVVVTGLGLITPVGNNVDTTWKNILAGQSGIINKDINTTVLCCNVTD